MYVIFVIFERASDSVTHSVIWGAPTSCTERPHVLSYMLRLKTVQYQFVQRAGIRQRFVMSPFLFNLRLDSRIKRALSEAHRIRWTPFTHLEDLDYSDDICLLAHTHDDMLTKLDCLSTLVGLKINFKTRKAMCLNTERLLPFALANETVTEGQPRMSPTA